MRVLVTGGAGFIGSHKVDALLSQGEDVAVVDHLKRPPRKWVADAMQRGVQLYVADVRELESLLPAFAAARPEVVLHLAAQVDVRRSVADPAFDAQVNVAGTVSVLEAARQVGTPRVVLASTAAVYGDPEQIPTPESAEIAPLSPYGTSKAAAEWYLGQYARLHGLSTLALRIANVYGPRQDPKGEAGVVAIFTGAAVDRRPVTIFGTGEQTRDYIYVDDVVAAWLAAARSTATGAVNVSTGVESSVMELATAFDLRCELSAARPGEVDRSCLDPASAARELDWRAAVPLGDGLQRTLQAA